MGILYFVLGFVFALVLVHFYPGIGTAIGAAWSWLKGKFSSNE
jgi:hypothetical protein